MYNIVTYLYIMYSRVRIIIILYYTTQSTGWASSLEDNNTSSVFRRFWNKIYNSSTLVLSILL